MKIAAFAMIALLPLCSASALADRTHAEPLATVAHRLGFVYTYLGSDDVVSLVGHGLAVVVRPGSPFFTVNDRVEPVEGEAPRYQGGDLFVSPEFTHQLATIERAAAKAAAPGRSEAMAENPAHINVAAPGGPLHNVTSVKLSAIAGSDDVSVSGEATPGSLVSIVLKAIASPDLPEIYLTRAFTIADNDGQFSKQVSTAPDYFSGSILIAEAAAIDDAKPMSARYTPPEK